MRFGVDLTPDLVGCRVLDKWGQEICPCFSGDTDTGICQIGFQDPATGVFLQNADGGSTVKVFVQFAPPLTLVPFAETETVVADEPIVVMEKT